MDNEHENAQQQRNRRRADDDKQRQQQQQQLVAVTPQRTESRCRGVVWHVAKWGRPYLKWQLLLLLASQHVLGAARGAYTAVAAACCSVAEKS